MPSGVRRRSTCHMCVGLSTPASSFLGEHARRLKHNDQDTWGKEEAEEEESVSFSSMKSRLHLLLKKTLVVVSFFFFRNVILWKQNLGLAQVFSGIKGFLSVVDSHF